VPVGQEQVTPLALHPGVVLGHSGQVLVHAKEVRLGVCLYPEVTRAVLNQGSMVAGKAAQSLLSR
jgi:hypothetical protein